MHLFCVSYHITSIMNPSSEITVTCIIPAPASTSFQYFEAERLRGEPNGLLLLMVFLKDSKERRTRRVLEAESFESGLAVTDGIASLACTICGCTHSTFLAKQRMPWWDWCEPAACRT